MLRRSLCLFPLLLFLAFPGAASADGDPDLRAAESVSTKGFDQIVYKGLLGNALDGIPMDPSQRVSLQRTNAVISNTLSGRSLAVLVGLSNPALLIGGLVWGIWSASNIKAEADGAKAPSYAIPNGGDSAGPQDRDAVVDRLLAAQGMIAKPVPVTEPSAPLAKAESDQPARVRSPVVKVWLPQRSPTVAFAQ